MSEPYYSAPQMHSDPQSQPIFGASFGTALKRYYGKYATFRGRASRSEYWWTQLYLSLIIIILYIPILPWYSDFLSSAASSSRYGSVSRSMPEMGPLTVVALIVVFIFALAHIIPNLAVLVRRLHDANMSGGFIFLSLIPFVGGLIVFVLTLQSSKPEGARFD